MKNNKPKLKDLEVQSFITSINSLDQLAGGAASLSVCIPPSKINCSYDDGCVTAQTCHLITASPNC